MSSKIVLEDQALISYARTDDAVKAFNMAVGNGQARLALEILVPIVNALASSEAVQEVKEDVITIEDVKGVSADTRPEKKAPAKPAPAKATQVAAKKEDTESQD